jgi:tetratricopeptide (TPR) repeat protein
VQPGFFACHVHIWVICVLAGTSCRSSAIERCERALADGKHAVAIERCTAMYEQRGTIRAAVNAAKAHFELGHDDDVEAWAQRLGDAPEAAGVWRLAAQVHERHDRQDAGREARGRALRAYRAAGELHQAAYEAYMLMNSHWRSSELLRALEYAQECHTLAHEAENPRMRMDATSGLFSMLFEIGDYRMAREVLDRARQTLDPDDLAARTILHFNEARLHKQQGRLRLARIGYERALELAPAAGRHVLMRAARLNLVEILIELDELDAAEEQLQAASREEPEKIDRNNITSRLFYQAKVQGARGRHEAAEQSLRQALDAGPIDDWIRELEHSLGRALEAQGLMDQAEAAYGRAIASIERMREAMKLDDYKTSFLAERRQPHEALFALRARAGRMHEALDVAEQARARAFLDAFARSARDADLPGAGDQELGHAAMSRLVAFDEMAPYLTASPVAEPHPIAEVLNKLARENVLFYFQAGDAMWLYSRAQGEEFLQKLATPAADIARAVERWLVDVDDRDAAAWLGATLLPRGALPRARDAVVYVIGDGATAGIPFAALRPNGRYLAVDHRIAHVPSLGALAALLEQGGDAREPAIVLGAPVSVGAELAGALSEAKAVAAELGVDAHTGRHATIAALRRAGRASLLHVATHGGLSPRGAWMELAEGRVHASQILAWNLRPRVAVLASCASGARHGKDMWGALGAAFLAAGSRAVVSTSWSVRDEPTRAFIESFYARGGALQPVRAVAEAQRQYIAKNAPPSQWAPFVVLGAAP